MNKTLCKPITFSGKAKQTLYEPSTVSAETNITLRQHVNTMCETIKVPHEPKTASAKAMWIAKSVVSCEARDRSLDLEIVSIRKTISALHRAKPRLSSEIRAKALCANSEVTELISSALLDSARLAASGKSKAQSAQIASSYEVNSTFYRVQPCLSREAKAKAPLCANSIADSASLSLPARSAKVLSREARNKALSAKDLNLEVKDEALLSVTARLFQPRPKEKLYIAKLSLPSKAELK